MTEQIALREQVAVRFYLDAGSLETKSLRPLDIALDLIEANHRLRDVLWEKGYFVHYHEFSGGHDYISWRGSFTDGVLALFE